MSCELPKYLDYLREKKIFKLMAFVEGDNIASEKLLTENGFVEMAKTRDVKTFAALLNYNQDILRDIVTNFGIDKIDKFI